MYLTFVMDIKRKAGSFATLGAALFFGSGTPLAKILLAGVGRCLMAAHSYLSELGRLLLWHLQKTCSPLEKKKCVLHFCNGHATRLITFFQAIKSVLMSGLLGEGRIVQTLSGQFEASFPLSWSAQWASRGTILSH